MLTSRSDATNGAAGLTSRNNCSIEKIENDCCCLMGFGRKSMSDEVKAETRKCKLMQQSGTCVAHEKEHGQQWSNCVQPRKSRDLMGHNYSLHSEL